MASGARLALSLPSTPSGWRRLHRSRSGKRLAVTNDCWCLCSNLRLNISPYLGCVSLNPKKRHQAQDQLLHSPSITQPFPTSHSKKYLPSLTRPHLPVNKLSHVPQRLCRGPGGLSDLSPSAPPVSLLSLLRSPASMLLFLPLSVVLNPRGILTAVFLSRCEGALVLVS